MPSSVDYRNTLPAVKSQGDALNGCKSCWAFATTATIEYLYNKATGRNVSLSEQQLVDCVTENGCRGSNIYNAMTYLTTIGIVSSADYPYVANYSDNRQFVIKV